MEGQRWSRQGQKEAGKMGWPGLGCCWRREEGGGSEINLRGRRARLRMHPIATSLSTTKTPPAPAQVARAAEVSGTTHNHPAFHSQPPPFCINLLFASLGPIRSCHTALLSFVPSPLSPHCGATRDHDRQGDRPRPAPQPAPSALPPSARPASSLCSPTTIQTMSV